MLSVFYMPSLLQILKIYCERKNKQATELELAHDLHGCPNNKMKRRPGFMCIFFVLHSPFFQSFFMVNLLMEMRCFKVCSSGYEHTLVYSAALGSGVNMSLATLCIIL